MSLAFVAGATETSPLTKARTTLEQWVETRQLTSKTRSDWETDREMMEQTRQLFERELKEVEEQMTKLSTNSTQVDKERAEAEAALKVSNEALERAREFAAGFEGRVTGLVPRLPVPLQDILKPLLARLPADPAVTKMPVTERIQVLVGILSEVDKFNNAVNLFSEKRRNEKGEEVAVETVYVGLGVAYFVNDADNFAGAGAPGQNGWEWSVKPELAELVREVVRIYRNERPARFVSLPVTIR